MRRFVTMCHKILLIFGTALCAVLMSGCIPMYWTNTYWGEINGRLTDVDGNPLVGVRLDASYCNIESKAITDANGEFVIPALRETHYIAYLFEDESSSPLTHGYVNLIINPAEYGFNFLIRWNIDNYEEIDYYIYLLDRYTSHEDSWNLINNKTWEPAYTRKYLVNLSSPELKLEYENVRIHFNSEMINNIKKSTILKSSPSYKPIPR